MVASYLAILGGERKRADWLLKLLHTLLSVAGKNFRIMRRVSIIVHADEEHK